MSLIFKYATTAFLVVLISEIAKRSDRFGGLVASLPLVTLLTLFWLYVEHQPTAKLVNHSFYTFWYVLGSLPFFIIFPLLLPKVSFFWAITISSVSTIVVFILYAIILKSFGIELL